MSEPIRVERRLLDTAVRFIDSTPNHMLEVSVRNGHLEVAAEHAIVSIPTYGNTNDAKAVLCVAKKASALLPKSGSLLELQIVMGSLTVRGEKSEFHFAGENRSTARFSALTMDPDPLILSVPARTFMHAKRSSSKRPARPELAGIFRQADQILSTDMYRATRVDADLTELGRNPVFVPSLIVDATETNDMSSFSVSVTPETISATNPTTGITFAVRRTHKNVPPVITKLFDAQRSESAHVFSVPREDFIRFADNSEAARLNANVLMWSEGKNMHISMQDVDRSEIMTVATSSYGTAMTQSSFDRQFMLDIFRGHKDKQLRMNRACGPSAPIFVHGEEASDAVMPRYR